jgi:hypothetical protein
MLVTSRTVLAEMKFCARVSEGARGAEAGRTCSQNVRMLLCDFSRVHAAYALASVSRSLLLLAKRALALEKTSDERHISSK